MVQNNGQKNDQDNGSKLFKLVSSLAISPEEANRKVENYFQQSYQKFPDDLHEQHEQRIAEKIIAVYAAQTGWAGALCSSTSIIPGVGTAVSLTAGTGSDIVACMKLQVDMCFCLAYLHGYDLTEQDTQHLVYLLAAGGLLGSRGAGEFEKLASKAGVRLLRQYLKGAALKTVKSLFRKIGIVFTRKAFEKSIPFGIGVVVSGFANRGVTRVVGNQAKQWFEIDKATPP